jgi:hypothetical protein
LPIGYAVKDAEQADGRKTKSKKQLRNRTRKNADKAQIKKWRLRRNGNCKTLDRIYRINRIWAAFGRRAEDSNYKGEADFGVASGFSPHRTEGIRLTSSPRGLRRTGRSASFQASPEGYAGQGARQARRRRTRCRAPFLLVLFFDEIVKKQFSRQARQEKFYTLMQNAPVAGMTMTKREQRKAQYSTLNDQFSMRRRYAPVVLINASMPYLSIEH